MVVDFFWREKRVFGNDLFSKTKVSKNRWTAAGLRGGNSCVFSLKVLSIKRKIAQVSILHINQKFGKMSCHYISNDSSRSLF